MRLVFEQVRTGGDRNLGYLIGDREAGEALLVDPSPAPEPLLERAQAQGLRILAILNTHGHPDHTLGNDLAQQRTGAPVYGGPGHTSPVDRVLEDGDEVGFGSYHLQVLTAPGHCPDHLAFLEPTFALGFTGDLLFVGKVGGTGSEADGRLEWDSLQRLLATWPAHTTLWPGHDYGARPSSTLALELATNPFLRCGNVETFLALKARWPAYKAQMGLR